MDTQAAVRRTTTRVAANSSGNGHEYAREAAASRWILRVPARSAGDRMDEWKEIAAYFKRSVRCVQRWERAEGMPVYRHQHVKVASVYAYRAELDAWWCAGNEAGPQSLEDAPRAIAGDSRLGEGHVMTRSEELAAPTPPPLSANP